MPIMPLYGVFVFLYGVFVVTLTDEDIRSTCQEEEEEEEEPVGGNVPSCPNVSSPIAARRPSRKRNSACLYPTLAIATSPLVMPVNGTSASNVWGVGEKPGGIVLESKAPYSAAPHADIAPSSQTASDDE
jgi:hypothetical protein